LAFCSSSSSFLTRPSKRKKKNTGSPLSTIDQFGYIKIQPNSIDLSTRLWGITTEIVGFIPQSLILRSIVQSKLAYYETKV